MGVRFISSEDEFNSLKTKQFPRKTPYCKMIQRVSNGDKFKVNIDNFACFASARVLGMVSMDEWYASGNYYNSCGLYNTKATALNVTKSISKIDFHVHGLEIKPLYMYTNQPDVVIIISNPRNIMRIVQSYSFYNGAKDNFKFMGNQAMCSELTVNPFVNDDINISLLCVGTREAGFKDSEMGIGISFSKLDMIVSGLYKTITPIETNRAKKIIKEKLEEKKISTEEIKFNYSYGDPLYEYDFSRFLPDYIKKESSENL